ncbi:unnamed protein product, partial [Effrenium voratum]
VSANYGGVADCLLRTAREEGLPALWKGLCPALVRQAPEGMLHIHVTWLQFSPANGRSLVIYEPIRGFYGQMLKNDQGASAVTRMQEWLKKRGPNFLQRLAAGGTAGALAISVFNPAEALGQKLVLSLVAEPFGVPCPRALAIEPRAHGCRSRIGTLAPLRPACAVVIIADLIFTISIGSWVAARVGWGPQDSKSGDSHGGGDTPGGDLLACGPDYGQTDPGGQAEDKIQGENYSLALTEAKKLERPQNTTLEEITLTKGNTLAKKVTETYTALENQAEKHGQRIPIQETEKNTEVCSSEANTRTVIGGHLRGPDHTSIGSGRQPFGPRAFGRIAGGSTTASTEDPTKRIAIEISDKPQELYTGITYSQEITYGSITIPESTAGRRASGRRTNTYNQSARQWSQQARSHFGHLVTAARLWTVIILMAATTAGYAGIPLNEYRRDVPPGWAPGLADYPLRHYFEKLRLWYRIYNGDDESVGPLVAGRLQGRAQRIAIQLRVPRPDGGIDTGDAALVRLSVDEVRDPVNPQIVLQQHIPSGVQSLCNALRDAFGQSDQDLVSVSLERFFELRRGKMTLREYSVEFDMRLEEATERAGLLINEVAKFYLYFKNSGLSQKFIEDIKLQIGGDLARFADAKSLALRLNSKTAESDGDIFYGNKQNNRDDDHDYVGEQWDAEEHEDWMSYYEEPWNEYEYYDSDYYAYDEEDYDFYPEEDWMWGTEEGAEGDPVDEAEETVTEQKDEFYQKGKGRGSPSCFICGSKWHLAASCPVNQGKGKDGKSGGKGYRPKGFGKSKGYRKGKGKFRKGGFRPWSGKSKGKGKGYGKSKDGDRGWYYARTQGLDISEVIQTAKDQPTKKVTTFAMNSVSDDELLSVKRSSASTSEASAGDKKLFFPTFIASGRFSNWHGIYHMIRNEKRRGLLVDPGAASGLIGSDTLRDLLENCVDPLNRSHEVQWKMEKINSVSGISGGSDKTLGEVRIPLKSSGHDIVYTGDVLGGEGSTCPALIGNPSLRELHASILTNWFENGDGLLVVQATPESKRQLLRILLTDSGHYILPTDHSSKVSQHTKEQVEQYMNQVVDESQKTWPDVKKCYLVAKQPKSILKKEPTTKEGNRCEVQTASPEEQPEEKKDKPQKSQPAHKEESFLTQEIQGREQDEWIETEEQLIRIHRAPRRMMFTPGLTTDCPLDSSLLDDQRMTEIKPVNQNHDKMMLKDEYRNTSVGNRDMSYLWTGKTIFYKKQKEMPDPAVQDEEFPHYREDDMPEYLDEKIHSKLKKRYKCVPEEYYTKTGFRPVTPKNFGSWFQAAKGRNLRWHAWELCSGSGRFSWFCVMAGLIVGFPVDFRYGWDIGNKSHQQMLWSAFEEFQPGTLQASPDCAPWSVSGNAKDYDQRMQERHAERPSLTFLKQMFSEQAAAGRGYCLEQPLGSAMWQSSPLEIDGLPEAKNRQRVDQCMHGAEDEKGNPVQKATGFGSNIRFRYTAKRCSGHKGRPHGQLQGNYQGFSRTAMSAVYPKRMCHNMVKDIQGFLQRRNLLFLRPWPRTMSWFVTEHYYDCVRCTLGRQTPPGIEHSMVPGQCRHGRWAPGTNPRASPLGDPVKNWKTRTSKKVLDSVEIIDEANLNLNVENSHYMKKALMEIVQLALGFFSEAVQRGINYKHWLTDQVLLGVVKDLLKDVILVKGIRSELRPWKKSPPEPEVQTSSAYLRLYIRGTVKRWTIKPVEDLREMSHAQIHEELEEDDWCVVIFGSVVKLAEEAVAGCPVCRKYVRLPNRPQTKVHGATTFNDSVQIDIFHLNQRQYLLMIDEATRYKVASVITSSEAEELLAVIMELWVRYFGPMKRLVLDQQSSLMSHETGAECERLGITRCPRGTTSGDAGKKHTGTGLVERHVQLTKLTMLKLYAELTRQGLVPEWKEIALEAAMAHNITLNYGGVTPSMSVFGVLPRGFYEEDSTGVLATAGALQTDLSVFERPGGSSFENETASLGRVKWNTTGTPGELTSDGEDQHFCYASMLMHVREHRGIYGYTQAEEAVVSLMKHAENLAPYRVQLMGAREYSLQEYHSSNYLKMKKVSGFLKEETCLIYLFYYKLETPEEPASEEIRRNTVVDMDVNVDMQIDQEGENRKRDSPETRTVVLAPEKKRTRFEYATQIMEQDLQFLLAYRHIANHKLCVTMDFPDVWSIHLGLTKNDGEEELKKLEEKRQDEVARMAQLLFHVQCKIEGKALADLSTGEIFKVDTEVDIIDHDGVVEVWPDVEAADLKEIEQFVNEGAFTKIHRSAWTDDMVFVDAIWVRKYKRLSDRKRIVKSRMCARGFLDKQKDQLATRSTTATRLSQRLLLSQAAMNGFELESLDVAGAFLKGFTFEKIHRQKGITTPTRKVVIFPPANVWRHLARLSKDLAVDPHRIVDYGLLCNKPVYGLNDAPLAWQLCLHEYLEQIGGAASQLDENTFIWKLHGTMVAIATTHVDDLAVASDKDWLREFYQGLLTRFGKVTRQVLPFAHCGALYEQIEDGYKVSQKEFCKKIKPVEVPKKPDQQPLTAEELTSFRSALGALLWLTATRLDLIADVSVLQSCVTTAQIKHLHMVNAVVKKAQLQQNVDLGLYYRKFRTNRQRLACIHDASSASKDRSYAQEGVLVLLVDDYIATGEFWKHDGYQNTCTDDTVAYHGGVAHVLYSHGSKAKRISYSTSHAETLAGIGGLEAATLVALRMGEMLHEATKPTLHQMINMQEKGIDNCPIDSYTDCRDLYELVTGEKSMPQDKTQRLYIMALKEARCTGRLRMWSLIPTECMTADDLTKPMTSKCLNALLSTGMLEFWNQPEHPVESKILPLVKDLEESDLMQNDKTLITKASTVATSAMVAATLAHGPIKKVFFMAWMVSTAQAVEDEKADVYDTTDYTLVLVVSITLMVIITERVVNEILKCCKIRSKPKTNKTTQTDADRDDTHRLNSEITRLELENERVREALRGRERNLAELRNQIRELRQQVLLSGALQVPSYLPGGAPIPGLRQLRRCSVHQGPVGSRCACKTSTLEAALLLPLWGCAWTNVGSVSMREVAARVWAQDGLLGFWAGLRPNVARTFLVNAAELGTYDEAKTRLVPHLGEGLLAHVGASGVAGFTSACVSTPADVVKTRLMNAAGGQKQYRGMVHAFSRILVDEGAAALYKGFLPICVRCSAQVIEGSIHPH